MTKSNKPKTHFEQVPLEIIKDIADQDVPKVKPGKSGGPPKPKKAATLRAYPPQAECTASIARVDLKD